MKSKRPPVLGALLLLALLATAAEADDLAGADDLLCTAREIQNCVPGGGCASVDPVELNVPDFVEVDLSAKLLRTTEASGENRSTPIQRLERVGGKIYLQGIESERAWSFLIVEETGQLTGSVAREERGVLLFGACTPRVAPR